MTATSATAALPKGLRRLALEAVVRVRRRVPLHATQAEMCQLFEVTDRTLRSWARIGLPVEDGKGRRPRYPLPDAYIWGLCYRCRCREGEPPRQLSVSEAHGWYLEQQVRDQPDGFLAVPLDWDHPARAELLERAAAGRAPAPEDER